jgi:hypothetical protein
MRAVLAGIALPLGSACSDSGGPAEQSITLSKSAVTFQAFIGGADPRPDTVMIGHSGTAPLTALGTAITYVSGTPGWLTATINQTTTPATLELDATPGAVTGTYSANVVVSAPGASASRTIATTLTVGPRGFLYTIRDSDSTLRRIDPITLAVTTIGNLGVEFAFGDCAWHPTRNTLYAVDGAGFRGVEFGTSLYTIDLTTGAATLVGDHGVFDMFALGYHPPSSSMYGSSVDTDDLYQFNVDNGAALIVGPTGGGYISGLAWDPVGQEFLGIDPDGFIYTVDVTTGTATELVTITATNDIGFTYDPVIDRFWAVDYSGNLFQYDPNADFARTTPAMGLGQQACIAYVP